MKYDPEIDDTLAPTPGARRVTRHNSNISTLSGISEGKQGTRISDRGLVSINTTIDDPNIPFLAVRNTVNFLEALYPGWSTPVYVGGDHASPPNEVGSTYSLQHTERKYIDGYDGLQDEATIMRKLTIVIHEIVNQPTIKRVSFNVHSRLVSDVYHDSFPAITFIVCEVKSISGDNSMFHFKVKFDGGPPKVVMKKACFCLTSAQSLREEEEAKEMKPGIYRQAESLIQYIRHYKPDIEIERQNFSKSRKTRRSIDDDSVSRGSKGSRGRMVLTRHQSNMSSASKADEIKKLYELYQIGALSKEEFELEKGKLLRGSASRLTREPMSPFQSQGTTIPAPEPDRDIF